MKGRYLYDVVLEKYRIEILVKNGSWQTWAYVKSENLAVDLMRQIEEAKSSDDVVIVRKYVDEEFVSASGAVGKGKATGTFRTY